MKRRIAILLLAGLVGALGGAIARFPAAQALALADTGNIQVYGVQGTVWSGAAERIEVPGMPPLAAVRWDIALSHLFAGRAGGVINFEMAGGQGEAEVTADPAGRIEVLGASFQGPAAGIARHLPVPLLIVEGEITGRLDAATLEDGWPRGVDGRIRWDGAELQQPLELVLGAATLVVEPADGGGHAIQVDVRDGAVRASGQGSVTADGVYDIEVRAEPTDAASQQVEGILEQVGRRDGSAYIIRDSGRLTF